MQNHYPSEITACFTGHRDISAAEIFTLRSRVSSALDQAYENNYRVFLCGGARGFDTLAALEVLKFRDSHPDIRLVIAVPCATQADYWPKQERDTWEHICSHADEVRILSEHYYNGCMQVRNRHMVEASSLCLCYMTRFEGGTWYTVRYAMRKGILLKNLAMPVKPVLKMKENPWNCISIFRSVSENAGTARLYPSLLQKKKRTRIYRFSSVKRS